MLFFKVLSRKMPIGRVRRLISRNRDVYVSRIIAAFALFAAMTTPAHAYVDPGVGSMFLQVLAAGIFTAVFYFKSMRVRLWSWIKRHPGPNGSAGAAAKPSDKGAVEP